MEYRQLGTDGPEVPIIGVGAWPLGGGMGEMDEQTAIDIVRTAIDEGATLVDTAQSYRDSEERVGKALKDGYRDRCFLATKVSNDYSPEAIHKSINESLSKLDVEYVDLYQIHGWSSQYPVEASMEAMVELQEEGKVRFIGVSNYNADQMQRASAITTFSSNQPAYNMFNRKIEKADIPYCEEHGIGILAHSPLGKGLLSGRYRPGHEFPEGDERRERFTGDSFAAHLAVADRLAEVAKDKEISMVQMAISWILRQETVTCVLVGAKSSEQVREHLSAATVEFTEDELSRIDTILEEAPTE